MIVFSLREAALVEFVVVQVSPDCRRMGRFRVQGHAGRNRVLFRGRIGRRALPPGTYRIQARAGRHRVVDTRLVIVRSGNRSEIRSARGADTCRSVSAATASATALQSAFGRPGGPAGAQRTAGSGADKPGSKPSNRGALGARFAQEAVDTVSDIPLWLFAVLGAAIALLAVAALPLHTTPNPQAAALLANRRGLIASAGAGALVVAMLVYALH